MDPRTQQSACAAGSQRKSRQWNGPRTHSGTARRSRRRLHRKTISLRRRPISACAWIREVSGARCGRSSRLARQAPCLPWRALVLGRPREGDLIGPRRCHGGSRGIQEGRELGEGTDDAMGGARGRRALIASGGRSGLAHAEHIKARRCGDDHPLRSKPRKEHMQEEHIGERDAQGTANNASLPPPLHSRPAFSFRNGICNRRPFYGCGVQADMPDKTVRQLSAFRRPSIGPRRRFPASGHFVQRFRPYPCCIPCCALARSSSVARRPPGPRGCHSGPQIPRPCGNKRARNIRQPTLRFAADAGSALTG